MREIKYLILKTATSRNIDGEEFERGILELRNTPDHTGHSSPQILHDRSIVPAYTGTFAEEWQAQGELCGSEQACDA